VPLALLALVASVLLAACGGADDAAERVAIETSGGTVLVHVEVADSRAERVAGLSGRTELGEDAGMLFVYDEDVTVGFWMKDTLLPLSVAFADAGGRIVAIVDMEPCHAEPCPAYRPDAAYRLALEVNRGAFARWGVAAGDRIVRGG
jgi:uncharacterized membrane protein (UPF0127 family)